MIYFILFNCIYNCNYFISFIFLTNIIKLLVTTLGKFNLRKTYF